jgi:hypothetical protein
LPPRLLIGANALLRRRLPTISPDEETRETG